MRHITSEEIAALKERLRQNRIKNGLPPDPLPLPQVVELPLVGALVKRLAPFKAIAVKLASILAKGHVTRIDVSKLGHYREYGQLLRYSRGTWGGLYAAGVAMVFREIERINSAIDDGQTGELDVNGVMRRLHLAISRFLSNEYRVGWDMKDVYGGYTEELRAAWAEEKRLISDPDAFQAAYDEALAQLPKKEEDDLYE